MSKFNEEVGPSTSGTSNTDNNSLDDLNDDNKDVLQDMDEDMDDEFQAMSDQIVSKNILFSQYQFYFKYILTL
ncbi:Hypothetical protein CINCED_3A011099 [Cinara cedri]|uniref:Uncharacterized protein n=1 Tax=Cinara cedri TaxID=506608 RepID=A0A5E4LXC3_9HEMI|nr:Hypothetical protein CINCED_3A011099 [Cinara cedri]